MNNNNNSCNPKLNFLPPLPLRLPSLCLPPLCPMLNMSPRPQFWHWIFEDTPLLRILRDPGNYWDESLEQWKIVFWQAKRIWGSACAVSHGALAKIVTWQWQEWSPLKSLVQWYSEIKEMPENDINGSRLVVWIWCERGDLIWKNGISQDRD